MNNVTTINYNPHATNAVDNAETLVTQHMFHAFLKIEELNRTERLIHERFKLPSSYYQLNRLVNRYELVKISLIEITKQITKTVMTDPNETFLMSYSTKQVTETLRTWTFCSLTQDNIDTLYHHGFDYRLMDLSIIEPSSRIMPTILEYLDNLIIKTQKDYDDMEMKAFNYVI